MTRQKLFTKHPNYSQNLFCMKTKNCLFSVPLLVYLNVALAISTIAQNEYLPKEINGVWGYVNQLGEIVIPLQFEWAGHFSYSSAFIKLDGKFGIINKLGNVMIVPSYDTLFHRPGAIVYGKANMLGILDTLGNKITNAIYERVEGGADRSLNVKRNGQWSNLQNGVERFEELSHLVFTTVDEGGMFPGCKEIDDKIALRECADSKMLQFMSENIKYPYEAAEEGISGYVYLSFMIDKQGNIVNIEIKKNPGKGLGEEALRVVSKMPKWVPGKVEGILVQTKFILPVKYALE